MRKLYFGISAFIHAVLILLLFLGGSAGGDGTGLFNTAAQNDKDGHGNEKGEDGDIAPKQIEIEIVEKPIKPETGDLPIAVPPPPKQGLTECVDARWYGGIGVRQDVFTSSFEQVEPGYPAHKAGLRPGDVIKSTSEPEIRGEPGTPITITIFRPTTGEYLTFHIIRDRICLGAKK